jgi:hypothetical protein
MVEEEEGGIGATRRSFKEKEIACKLFVLT